MSGVLSRNLPMCCQSDALDYAWHPLYCPQCHARWYGYTDSTTATRMPLSPRFAWFSSVSISLISFAETDFSKPLWMVKVCQLPWLRLMCLRASCLDDFIRTVPTVWDAVVVVPIRHWPIYQSILIWEWIVPSMPSLMRQQCFVKFYKWFYKV